MTTITSLHEQFVQKGAYEPTQGCVSDLMVEAATNDQAVADGAVVYLEILEGDAIAGIYLDVEQSQALAKMIRHLVNSATE